MGSTEHETDSGMDDILESIRQIISEEPLESELPQPQQTFANPAPNPAANTTPNPAQIPTSPPAQYNNVQPNGIAPNTPTPTPLHGAGINGAVSDNNVGHNADTNPGTNANMTHKLANALEHQMSQPAPTTIKQNGGEGLNGYNGQTNGQYSNPPIGAPENEILDLTEPLAQPMPAGPTFSTRPEPTPVPAMPQHAIPQTPQPMATPAPQSTTPLTTPQMPSPQMTQAPLGAPNQSRPMPQAAAPQVVEPQMPISALVPISAPVQEQQPVAQLTGEQFGSTFSNGATAPQNIPDTNIPAPDAPQPREQNPIAAEIALPEEPQVEQKVEQKAEQKSNGFSALQEALEGVSTAAPKSAALATAVAMTELNNTSGHETENELDKAAPTLPTSKLASLSPTEQAMRDLLKPMITDWLDANMPRLVEEVLREDIEIVRKSDE